MLIFRYGFWPTTAVLILILIIFGFTAAALGKWQFNQQVESELNKLKEQNRKISAETAIKTEDLSKLPEPVKLWLDKIGVVEKNRISAVHLKQKGLMKLEPEQNKWFAPQARQYTAVNQPGFLWQVDLSMLPVIKTKGRDLFYQGDASMLIKIAGLLPVVDQKANRKINESALHRFLLELPWYPTAALNDYLEWQVIDSNTARATITYQGIEAEADFNFDQQGNLVSTEAMRYKESDEDAERLKCIGELKKYKEVDGIKVPTGIDVSWDLESGKFTWFKVEVDEISFEY